MSVGFRKVEETMLGANLVKREKRDEEQDILSPSFH